ncbi:MAG TPA: hypothetical protein VII92_03550, partial [Anaerolineae bacterium]
PACAKPSPKSKNRINLSRTAAALSLPLFYFHQPSPLHKSRIHVRKGKVCYEIEMHLIANWFYK